jgi:hypothetical protein
MVEECLRTHESPLAYTAYRVWADYWQFRRGLYGRVLPLHHFADVKRGVVMAAPMATIEIEGFIASLTDHSEVFAREDGELVGVEWIGSWCLFSLFSRY